MDALEEDGGTFAIHSQAGVVDVPAEQWLSFLNSFSRQHEGWLTSITVEQNGKQQTPVREAKLEGISSDHLTTRGEIFLSLSRDDGTHLIHRMSNPIEVVFRRDLAGAHEGIDITSADETLTKVHFRIAARPETLDGVVDAEHPRTR